MTDISRRRLLTSLAVASAAAGLPPSIARALAVAPDQRTGTIKDVRHIVILMQENRSIDHYFGTLRGVRGFGDRHTVPLPGGRSVWQQSDGSREVPPFHLDTSTTDALKVPGTPHSFSDAQAAWNQGRFGEWPRYKTRFSMGYYRREDIPFQFALAESFTLCDAYHCSVTAGTDPNRIVFWSGSNFDPAARARGENSIEANSEPDNLRCWVKGTMPEPGYTYQSNALSWPTLPDLLEHAGVDWRIYQDPNNNWTGAMHGGLAFASFRECKPGSGLYERGMRRHTLQQLASDVRENRLPAVSWVLPPKEWSEHPSASTPLEGAAFTARVLDALTANPAVWSGTVMFVTFDENDGLFDHVPPPSPPTLDDAGQPQGKATFDLRGHYFYDEGRRHLDPHDQASGLVRPWAMGPRVPMYVLSPWSRGGWVDSQVFDHTSVGRFLEQRFDITVPAISPWHRAASGDMTSAFDFAADADASVPKLPDVSNANAVLLTHLQKPKIEVPSQARPALQEPGTRGSRALPYELHVDFRPAPGGAVQLNFVNAGRAGAVLHVYDRLRLERLPRRYTVEAGKQLQDVWQPAEGGNYDLYVMGPNGFLRHYSGTVAASEAAPLIVARYERNGPQLALRRAGGAGRRAPLQVRSDVYAPAQVTDMPAQFQWSAAASGGWYDLVVTGPGFEQRYAGRIETGAHGISDPAMGSAG
jgi:phospholipase C